MEWWEESNKEMGVRMKTSAKEHTSVKPTYKAVVTEQVSTIPKSERFEGELCIKQVGNGGDSSQHADANGHRAGAGDGDTNIYPDNGKRGEGKVSSKSMRPALSSILIIFLP